MYSQPPNRRSEFSYLKQLAQDMKELKVAVADLRENRVKPDQIYSREVIDGMIADLKDEIGSIKEIMQEQRQALFKYLAIAGSAITIVILIAQHVTIH